jgi:N-methylhydantoinase A
VEAAFGAAIPSGSGFDARTAALGVQRIVDEAMAAATRLHFAEKGKDPRSHTLIAFGGAGPVHAHHLARLLRIGRVLIPFGAGVASALGFLVAPPATDMVRTYVTRLEQADWGRANAMLEEMRERGHGLLVEAGSEPAEIACEASADMRHVGQGFEIPVPLPATALSAEDLPAIRASFFEVYRARFGRAVEEVPLEIISWRLACRAPPREISLAPSDAAGAASLEAARRGHRKVLFETHGWQECAVYDRNKLAIGARFPGPALIEERESTCVVGPGALVSVDGLRNLVLDLC